MNVDKEIQSTIRPCLRSAIKRWFDLQGKETPTEKQHDEIIKAFDTAYGILSLIDINIMDNYKSSTFSPKNQTYQFYPSRSDMG